MRYLAIGWANVEKGEREVEGGGGEREVEGDREGERWREIERGSGGGERERWKKIERVRCGED